MNRKKQMQILAHCKPDPYHDQWLDIRTTLNALDAMAKRLTMIDYLILLRQPTRRGFYRLGSYRHGSHHLGAIRIGTARIGSLKLGSVRAATLGIGSTFDAVQHCADHERDIQAFRQPTQQTELVKNISTRTIRSVRYG